MLMTAPDYCSGFRCIAGRCGHTCCAGWEIDIDEETAARYAAVQGEMGERLRACIEPAGGEEPAHFRLTGGERCPFLNGENLCDLILTLGEDSLCQICTDHPRFRSFWSDRTELGLGLACEEAARIILSRQEKVQIVVLEDDGVREEVPREERELRMLRDELIGILQDRRFPVDERILRMLERCGLRDDTLRFEEGPLNETACEQFAVYLVWRNFADALYDGRVEDRVRFCAESYCCVRGEWARAGKTDPEDLIEAARAFSDEIEYDTDTWGME